MADIKKEQDRDELHRAIWSIADDLRGSVDGWDFKSYVLGTMFYRFISENLTSYINKGEWEAGNPDFNYADMSDADAEEARAGLVEEKGFFISRQNCSATYARKQRTMKISMKRLKKCSPTLKNLQRVLFPKTAFQVCLMISM